MPKKHGTVRPAVRPSGSVNRDRFGRFGRFGLFQSLNDVVHFSFFFFFPKRRRSETAPAFFVLSLLYGVVLPSLKVLKPFLISHFSFLNTTLCPLSKSLKRRPHTLKSSLSNPRTSQLTLKNHSQITLKSSLSNPLSQILALHSSQLPRRRALRSSLAPSQLSPSLFLKVFSDPLLQFIFILFIYDF